MSIVESGGRKGFATLCILNKCLPLTSSAVCTLYSLSGDIMDYKQLIDDTIFMFEYIRNEKSEQNYEEILEIVSTTNLVVLAGRHLKHEDVGSEDDAYVELWLDDQKDKQRTKVINNSNNPTWNETLVFDLGDKKCDYLHMAVYDKDPVGQDHIGSAKVNLKNVYDSGESTEWISLVPGTGGTAINGLVHLKMKYEN
ncbi:unnamed protein product [Didymodactylos carnosus]|uniref:C2 domain-containing protein n=1 Tax=Didymodactylos carnosus TaxID=1234261 RepID=A0A813YG12_9BILA|nr:unnamed protein product [Didymodactylos carnosus]CAF1081331.1 unnamed protein product [Didymodactylos carnosus]CAF3669510.1 unnamed protein product [Didymodactylos carnosus]CAF3844273.1 unnamed protein product [Didymodactylos carnosus]